MDKVEYAVVACESVVERYAAEADAIADAAARDESEAASVVMEVTSGTHKSRTQVWPKAGVTHSV